MEKFTEELNKELGKATTISELLEVYKKINTEVNISLENAIRRITFANCDDGK